jgi:hypothetical protein
MGYRLSKEMICPQKKPAVNRMNFLGQPKLEGGDGEAKGKSSGEDRYIKINPKI